jgi:hypothetical protein
LPDFSWKNIPKWENMHQITTQYTKMAIKFTKRLKNTKHGRKIHQYFTFQGVQKDSEIGILVSFWQIYHLATRVLAPRMTAEMTF